MPNARALILVAGLAAALPAAAEEARFDFSVSGIKIGTLEMGSDASGDRYTASSKIETSGLVSVFANFFFDGTASGSLKGSRVVPSSYDATSKSPRALRRTEIDWKGGTPVRVSVEPPRSSAPDPATQAGTLDPVSAGFRLLRSVPTTALCNTTVDVFDGSRRSRLTVARPEISGTSATCEGTFARIEGEANTMTVDRPFAFSLTFAIDGDSARLQRIDAPTSFGQAVISRRG